MEIERVRQRETKRVCEYDRERERNGDRESKTERDTHR